MLIKDIPAALQKLSAAGVYRHVADFRMITPTLAESPSGERFIVFNSNNYLGLTHRREVIEAAAKALQYGTGSGGARLTSGSSFEISRLEKHFARFRGSEDALVFNTGYMTNLGVLFALASKDDVIFSDALNHASIIDGCRISRAKVVVYPHADAEALEKLMKENPTDGQRFIVTDGVFSMDGDIAPLPDLARLRDEYHAFLITDEAHAAGVIGRTGRGTGEYFGNPKLSDLTVGTLSKTLASEGGCAASSKDVIEFLRNRSRPFIFSTAISPSTAAAADAALTILENEGGSLMERLGRNVAFMRKTLTEAGLPVVPGETAIIPVILGDPEKAVMLAAKCREQHILLSAIRPPSVPAGTSRIRLTVTAAHTEEELSRASETIIRAFREEL